MGEINVSVRILKGKAPILFSWVNSSTNAIEGCLVTCPCQGYDLQEKPKDRNAFDMELGKAMGNASILSLSCGIHFTSVVDRLQFQELEDMESDEVLAKAKRRRKRNLKVKVEKKVKTDEKEQSFVGEGGAKSPAVEEKTNKDGGVQGESSVDSSLVAGGVDEREDETEPADEALDISESDELEEARTIAATDESEVLQSVSEKMIKSSKFKDYNHLQSDSSTGEPSSQMSGSQSEVIAEGPRTSSVKQESVLDQFQTVFQSDEVQHIANTVEVAVEENQGGRMGISQTSHPTGVISTNHSTLSTTLTVPVTLRDGEETTYLNMEGIKVIQSPSADGVMVSQGSGENYITMFTDQQTGTLSAEQEQVLLKTLEGILNANSSGEGNFQEPTHLVTEGRPGPAEMDDYTIKVIQGEVCGPLKKADQARMDKYLEFKEHKDAEFTRKYHKYQNTKGARFVLCELCGAPLTNKNIKLHMAAMHQAPEERTRNFECSICGKSFLYQNNLKRHLDTHLRKRYKCQYCEKSYSQDHSRKLHEKEHFGEVKKTLRNPFATLEEKNETGKPSTLKPNVFVTCEICKKNLRPTSLKGHMSTHKNDYFTCEICGKVLRVSGKREHMIRHSGVKNFQCVVCEKKFASKGSLEAHIRVHTQERPYRCKYCSECFRTSHTRNTHQRIHTGEKPYHCDRCDKSWRDRTTYWGHMKKHHPGVPLMYVRKSLQIQAARDAMQAQALESVENIAEEMTEQSMVTADTSSTIQIVTLN